MTCKVLVADDDAYITNVVARKLQNAGLDVIVAMDGREAYERAIAERPDFLITDLQMPGMNGLELSALLTAKGFEIDRTDTDHLPILHVMSKPFSPRELLDNVRGAVEIGSLS